MELPMNAYSFVCDSCVASMKAQDTSGHSLFIQDNEPNHNVKDFKHGKHAPDVYTKMELGDVDLTRMTNNQPTTSIHPSGALPSRKGGLADLPLPKHLRTVPEQRTPLTLEDMTSGQPQDYVDLIKALLEKYPEPEGLDHTYFPKDLPYGASFDKTTGTYTFTGEPLLYEDFVGERITTRIAIEVNYSLTKPALSTPIPARHPWDSKTSIYAMEEANSERPITVKGIYADMNGNIVFGETLNEKDREGLMPYIGKLPRGTPYIIRIVRTEEDDVYFGAFSNQPISAQYMHSIVVAMRQLYWHNYVPILGKSINKHSHPVGEILLRKE
jgi:hypothetical protein